MKVTILARRHELAAGKSSAAFIHALRLARAVNTIRFILDHASNGRDEDSVEAMRARYSGGILLAAAVEEMLHVLHDRELREALREEPEVAPLLELADEPLITQLRNGYLKRLRNKLAFHYVAKHIKAALRDPVPDPAVVIQWDEAPTSGAFYVVPEIDVLLSIPEAEVPDAARVSELQARYPFTHALAVPPGQMGDDLRRYFECLNLVMILAFALTKLADAVLVKQFEAMGAMRGEERDEGAFDRLAGSAGAPDELTPEASGEAKEIFRDGG